MIFAVEHEKFQGPLHFLLEEIEREKLSVSEFALAKITDSFLRYVKTLSAEKETEISEFLVVASRLLLIKSRTLLPELPLTEEEKLSVNELYDRLKLLGNIRERMEDLRDALKKGDVMRERESLQGIPIVFYVPADLSPDGLADAFKQVLAAIPKPQKLKEEEIKKVLSLEEAIQALQESLQTRAEEFFSNIVKSSKDKTEIIVNFLALLELARQKIIHLKQEKAFGDIVIKRHGEGKSQ